MVGFIGKPFLGAFQNSFINMTKDIFVTLNTGNSKGFGTYDLGTMDKDQIYISHLNYQILFLINHNIAVIL